MDFERAARDIVIYLGSGFASVNYLIGELPAFLRSNSAVIEVVGSLHRFG